MPHAEVLGWCAAALMVATFACRDARRMRPLAVATNLAFIGYGVAASLAPVLALHALLLPINLWRWAETPGAGVLTMIRTLHPAPWRATAMGLLLVLLAACGGGGTEEPPLERTSVKRSWQLDEITGDGRAPSGPPLSADRQETMEPLLKMALLGAFSFVPPEYTENSTAEVGVFSNSTGMTFAALAEAPAGRLGSDDAIGGKAHFEQMQGYRKIADDATLEYVVSEVLLDLIDENGQTATLAECPWGDTFNEVDCGSLMRAYTAYTIDAWVDADRSGDSYELQVLHTDGEVDVSGYRHFGFTVLVDPIWAAPLWGPAQFDVFEEKFSDGTQRRARVKLREPVVVRVPLDRVPLRGNFVVRTWVDALAFNHRQRESYVSTYLRDPATMAGTPGVQVRMTGVEPAPILGDVVAENADDTPACPTGPLPEAGTLSFESATYAERELPGGGARIAVVRTGGATGPASVRLRTGSGSATPAFDYAALDRRLVFREGETRRVVRVPILLDAEQEPSETVPLTLSEVRGCASLGRADATLTILDDDRPPAPPLPSYRVGGTVTGLAGSGLVLEDRSRSITLPITANGSFFFGPTYLAGAAYDVQVRTPPSGPLQNCTVTRGSGTVAAEVNDIAVDCVTPRPPLGLDPTFGGGSGTVTTGPRGAMKAIALRPDGRIVAAIGNAVAQYRADGTLDTSFGSGGSVAEVLGSTSAGAEILDILLQPDGRIVAAGTARGTSVSTLAYDFAAARLNADGSRDTGFNGGLPLQVDWIGAPDRATRVLLQPDGRIVLAGTATTLYTSSTDDAGFAVVRLNPDGTLDTSFGTGGRAAGEIGQLDFGQAALLQPDGHIVVAGRTSMSRGDDPHFGAVRFRPDGTLDPSFGSGGKVFVAELGEATAMAQQPDGKLVFAVAQRVGGDFGFGAVRLLADGSADTGFGTGGLAVRQIVAGQDTPAALALQADGGLVLAGLALSTATSFDFVVTRFGPDGTPDPVFSFVFDFFAARDGAYDLLVQPDGKVLAAGQAGSGLSVFPMLLRLNP